MSEIGKPLSLSDVITSELDRELWVQWNQRFGECEVYKIRFFVIFHEQYFYSSMDGTPYWYNWYGSRYVVWDHEPTKAEQENVEWEASNDEND